MKEEIICPKCETDTYQGMCPDCGNHYMGARTAFSDNFLM